MSKKKSFDSYSKKPLKDEVRKAMNRYFNQLDQINSKLEIATDGLSEIEKRINSFQDQESNLKAEVLDLADQKANRDEILDEVKVLTSQKEEITQYNLQYQNAQSKLEEARNAYSQIKLDERKERVS